ncbi:MAG: hypothetical protein Q7R91_00990 [bacterium]|nr:hypothetical protein [bacterium]
MDFLTGKDLNNEEALEQILMLEQAIDQLVAEEEISEMDGWDAYFGLLHECDERGFMEERRRIVTKIDTRRYDPFKSKNAGIQIITRLRVVRLKIPNPGNN